MIRRFGQICGISAENRDRYIELHAHLSPKIRALIKECNLRNYSIFVKDELLFCYFEYVGEDFGEDMRKMDENADNREWWSVVKPIMSPLASRNPGEFWADMEQIFFQE